MNVSDLTIGHIGQTVSISNRYGTHTGRLEGIDAASEITTLLNGDSFIAQPEIALVIDGTIVPTHCAATIEIQETP